MISKYYRLPASVNLRIIGDCNLACPFCYGPIHSLPATNTKELIKFIKLLPGLGVSRVVVTGGEPLLVPDVVEILHEIHLQQTRILLNTNGVLLGDKIDQICSRIDWLALPLDADNTKVNVLMRPGRVHALTHIDLQTTIPYLRQNFPNLKIRIGTVVSRINSNNVLGIPELISGPLKPDVWKLYQFTPASYGSINRKMLDIPENEFEKIVELARERAAKFNINVEVYRVSTRDQMYFFLEPNGDAMIVSNGKEEVIGNCFQDLDTVIKVCSERLDYDEIMLQTIARG